MFGQSDLSTLLWRGCFLLIVSTFILQAKWVAAPPKSKDQTTLQAEGLWIDYADLAKASYRLLE